VHLLVDSTGLKLCGAGEWLVEKHGTRTRRAWRKLHLGVDADTGQIVAAALTSKEVDDAVQVGPLLDKAGTCMGLLVSSVFRCRQLSLLSFSSFFVRLESRFSAPGLHPGSEPRGAAVNIAVGTAGGGAKRC
jgi:hypothetical protein